MVVSQNLFRDEELNHPKDFLEKKGFKVYIAAEKKAEAVGMFGTKVLADYSLQEAASLKFDSLLIVGGSGAPDYLWGNQTLIAIANSYHAIGKPVGAICLAPVVLAQAGLLKGAEATVYKTEESMAQFEKHGVKMVYKDVVVSGLIVTANGPAAARSFGEAFGSLLLG